MTGRADAETVRQLVHARGRDSAHVLAEEMQNVTSAAGQAGFLYFRVTSTLAPDKLTTELGALIGDVVRQHCWGSEDAPA